jgi:predicted MPP superfamily phosphohydrolase
MKKSAKMTLAVSLATVTVAAVAITAIAVDERIKVRTVKIPTDKVDSEIRILHLSDLHSSPFGKEQAELILRIDSLSPDVILMTGDIFENRKTNEEAETLLADIGLRYPCYYVSGNHEVATLKLKKIKKQIASYGVKVLEGETVVFEVNGQSVSISGIDDPLAFPDSKGRLWEDQLRDCNDDISEDVFSVLLTHRPEHADLYTDTDFDLILSGHAHGGQVIIPGIVNGIYAPHQGFFPEYAGGTFTLKDSQTMVVSRGLSKYVRPRVFNRPELVLIELVPEK